MRWFLFLALLHTLGCGSDPVPHIVRLWTHESTAFVTAPGTGTQDRLLIAQKDDPQTWYQLDRFTGNILEGPFTGRALAHAPLALQENRLVGVTTLGRVVYYQLTDGVEQGTLSPLLNNTLPPVAVDHTAWIVSTSGQALLINDAQEIVHNITLPGTPTGHVVANTTHLFVPLFEGMVAQIASSDGAIETKPCPSLTRTVWVDADGTLFCGGDRGFFAYPPHTDTATEIELNTVVTYLARGADGSLLVSTETGLYVYDDLNAPRFHFPSTQPLHVQALGLADRFVTFDQTGTLSLLQADGTLLDQITLDAAPESTLQVFDTKVYLSAGNKVYGFDFGVSF